MLRFIRIGDTGFRVDHDPSDSAKADLVFIHELGGSLESWDALLPLLEDRVALRYDFRGAGLSGKIRGAVSLAAMAADLHAILDALGIRHPVVLVGSALGATIALKFAASFPERVAGVVALAPATGVNAAVRGFILTRADEFEAQGMAPFTDASLDHNYPEQLRDERYEQYVNRWLGNDPTSFAALFRMVTEIDVGDMSGAIQCPVLAVAGSLDANRSPEDIARALERLPSLSNTTIPSGHFMAVQSPSLVAQKIAGFMEGLDCGA